MMARERRAENEFCYIDLADYEADQEPVRAALSVKRGWRALGFIRRPTVDDFRAWAEKDRLETMVYGEVGEEPAGAIFLDHDGQYTFHVFPFGDPAENLDLAEESVALFLSWLFEERDYAEVFHELDVEAAPDEAVRRFFDAGFELVDEVSHGVLRLRMEREVWLAMTAEQDE